MKDKIQSFLLTPVKVSYKKSSDYTLIEKLILNPMFLAFLVFLITFQAYSVSGTPKSTESDSQLGNAMVFFERGDFDNAFLMLDEIILNYPNTKAANQAKFYIGRTAFINGDNKTAIDNLRSSVKKLDIDILKKESYMMLALLEKNYKKYDSALRYTISSDEKKYINILKAKMLAENGDVERAMMVLDSIDTNNDVYNDFFEEVYGFVLSTN
jgi:predicted negative regulator of RcsB-dependent stress response|tara:strand:- start:3944 stop:4579 length:636 start_codon:yes stop_codon:yes gene_type:complete